MKLEFVALQCDTLSQFTNRIYPRAVVEKALKKYQKCIEEGIAEVGMNDEGSYNTEMNVKDIAAKVESAKIDEQGRLVVSIDTLDTPMGKIVEQMNQLGAVSCRIGPIAIGTVDNKNVVGDDYEIVNFGIYSQGK